jgi:hypothetical protein
MEQISNRVHSLFKAGCGSLLLDDSFDFRSFVQHDVSYTMPHLAKLRCLSLEFGFLLLGFLLLCDLLLPREINDLQQKSVPKWLCAGVHACMKRLLPSHCCHVDSHTCLA